MQYLIPGYGFVNETDAKQYLIPGYGFVNETEVDEDEIGAKYLNINSFQPQIYEAGSVLR